MTDTDRLTKGTTVKEDSALRPGIELDDEGEQGCDGGDMKERLDTDRGVPPCLVMDVRLIKRRLGERNVKKIVVNLEREAAAGKVDRRRECQQTAVQSESRRVSGYKVDERSG